MLLHRPFYFLRHGETDFNLNRRAQGQIDIPLNATGVTQAKLAAELVRGLGVAKICASPLTRAYETARHSAEAAGVDIAVIENLRECGLGADEGRMGGSWFGDWRMGTYTPEGAERYVDFLARAAGGVNDALSYADDDALLIVAHGGVYWSILHYAGLDTTRNVANGEVMLFEPPTKTRSDWLVKALR